MTRKHFLALVKSFIAQYDLDLQNAVLLLGGAAALMRLQRFRRALTAPKPKYDRLHRELNWLCDLLNLENVGDFDSEESGCFAMIDPTDDVVWTICVLTDIAQGLLDDFYEISDATGDDQSEVAA
ncbi:hypothetical protein [Sulfitobacter sp.]|jgi:hypothetical protein|uniref:hypothetical protein n=1 Tax=Sulfitobacter sp. TaxID=1903071 RepID=UPI0039E691A5